MPLDQYEAHGDNCLSYLEKGDLVGDLIRALCVVNREESRN